MRSLSRLRPHRPARLRHSSNVQPQPGTGEQIAALNAPAAPVDGTQFTLAAGASAAQAAPAATPAPDPHAPAFADWDWTWLNGNPRNKDVAFDSPFFTPEIRADITYTYDFNHPIDDSMSGSSELFRSNEIQLNSSAWAATFIRTARTSGS
jgi:hypothetical protein